MPLNMGRCSIWGCWRRGNMVAALGPAVLGESETSLMQSLLLLLLIPFGSIIIFWKRRISVTNIVNGYWIATNQKWHNDLVYKVLIFLYNYQLGVFNSIDCLYFCIISPYSYQYIMGSKFQRGKQLDKPFLNLS